MLAGKILHAQIRGSFAPYHYAMRLQANKLKPLPPVYLQSASTVGDFFRTDRFSARVDKLLQPNIIDEYLFGDDFVSKELDTKPLKIAMFHKLWQIGLYSRLLNDAGWQERFLDVFHNAEVEVPYSVDRLIADQIDYNPQSRVSQVVDYSEGEFGDLNISLGNMHYSYNLTPLLCTKRYISGTSYNRNIFHFDITRSIKTTLEVRTWGTLISSNCLWHRFRQSKCGNVTTSHFRFVDSYSRVSDCYITPSIEKLDSLPWI